MSHLTDDEIQAYLDGTLIFNRSNLEQHLKICDQCRRNFNAFREVYHVLRQDHAEKLSPQFSQKVIEKIPIKGNRSQKSPEVWILSFSILGAVSLLYFLMPLASFFQIFSSGMGTILSLFKDLFAQFNETIRLMNPNVMNPLILAGLILTLIGFIDRFLLQPRFRRGFSK